MLQQADLPGFIRARPLAASLGTSGLAENGGLNSSAGQLRQWTDLPYMVCILRPGFKHDEAHYQPLT